jgi:hypothetical protein
VEGVIAVFEIDIDPVVVIGFGARVIPVPAEIEVTDPVPTADHFNPVV